MVGRMTSWLTIWRSITAGIVHDPVTDDQIETRQNAVYAFRDAVSDDDAAAMLRRLSDADANAAWLQCNDDDDGDVRTAFAWHMAMNPDWMDPLAGCAKQRSGGADWSVEAWHVRGDVYVTYDGGEWYAVRRSTFGDREDGGNDDIAEIGEYGSAADALAAAIAATF
jgi:hypothetical protein